MHLGNSLLNTNLIWLLKFIRGLTVFFTYVCSLILLTSLSFLPFCLSPYSQLITLPLLYIVMATPSYNHQLYKLNLKPSSPSPSFYPLHPMRISPYILQDPSPVSFLRMHPSPFYLSCIVLSLSLVDICSSLQHKLMF